MTFRITKMKQQEKTTLLLGLGVNALMVIGKIVLGIITSSGFLFVSALVTLMAFATKLIGLLELYGKKKIGVLQAFLYMGITISIGAIGYTSYMARLFFFPKMDHYDIYQGITIAAFAFTDLGWAIHGLIREAKNKNIVAAGLKCGALSNGLSALILAQTAIFAFTNPNIDYSFYNALGGTIFGAIDLLIGLVMIGYSSYRSHREDLK